MHGAPMRQVVGERVVLRETIVPEGDIADVPAPTHGELGARDVREEELEERVALGARELVDVRGEARIDEETETLRDRMHTNHRMNDGRILGEHLAILGLVLARAPALGGKRLGDVVRGGERGEEGLKWLRERVERGGRRRPARVAAARGGDAQRLEHGAERRRLYEGDVGVPVVVVGRILVVGVEHDDLGHLLDVGVERMAVQRAKFGGKIAQMRRLKRVLTAEKQNVVLHQRRLELRHVDASATGQVDAIDQCADCRTQRRQCQCGETTCA